MLPKTTEYALRAMTQLALLEPGQTAPVAALAQSAHIPKHYLSKLMRQLVVADLVHSQRGHGGGFCLARPADAITFAEILEAVGFLDGEAACIFGWKECSNERPCPLHPMWTRVREQTRAAATNTTLQSVIDEDVDFL